MCRPFASWSRDMSLSLTRERACARVYLIATADRICVWQTNNLLAAFATVLQTNFTTAFATWSLQTTNVLTVATAFPGNHKFAYCYYSISFQVTFFSFCNVVKWGHVCILINFKNVPPSATLCRRIASQLASGTFQVLQSSLQPWFCALLWLLSMRAMP